MTQDKRSSIYFDREKLCFFGIDDEIIKHLENKFPDLQIELQLYKMSKWLQSPKGKNRKGCYSFIINWLKNSFSTQTKEVTVSSGAMNQYLEGLWLNREHILALNRA